MASSEIGISNCREKSLSNKYGCEKKGALHKNCSKTEDWRHTKYIKYNVVRIKHILSKHQSNGGVK